MNLEIVLFWAALLSLVLMVLRGRLSGWTWLAAVATAASLAALIALPAAAPWIALSLALGLFWVPTQVARLARATARRQNYTATRWLTLLIAALHPMDGWPTQTRLFAVLARAARGDWPAAEAGLRRVVSHGSHPNNRLSALAHLCAHSGDWQPILAQPHPSDAEGAWTVLRLRALGETGQVETMLAAYAADEAELRKNKLLGPALLSVLAFGGRPDALRAARRKMLRGMSADMLDFWQATAQQAAGGAAADEGAETLRRTRAPRRCGGSPRRRARPKRAARRHGAWPRRLRCPICRRGRAPRSIAPPPPPVPPPPPAPPRSAAASRAPG
ncbi:MAG TPA: hypothetical protein VJY39_19275 [Acidisphaera sp.]|nr:hypothetical protein [Acidisphaera sp.]